MEVVSLTNTSAYGPLWQGRGDGVKAAVAMGILFPELQPVLGSPADWKRAVAWAEEAWSPPTPLLDIAPDADLCLKAKAAYARAVDLCYLQGLKQGGTVAPGIYVAVGVMIEG